MNSVQVEQKSYEMPPKEGISIAQFLTPIDSPSLVGQSCLVSRRHGKEYQMDGTNGLKETRA
jgi:hypothetical protein